MNNQILVFVYGTLKRGFKLHTYAGFDKNEFIGIDSIKGELYGEKNGYPILTRGNNVVVGEVFAVTPETLGRLINMEEDAGYNTAFAMTDKNRKVFFFYMKNPKEYWLAYPITEWTKALDSNE